MFNVEYSVVIFLDRGTTIFTRMAKIPFPPYIGLTLNSDAAGSYDLERVGWLERLGMFMTEGTVFRREWTLEQAVLSFEKVGWKEEQRARSFATAPIEKSKARRRARKAKSPQE